MGIILERLAHQLIENHPDFERTVLIGLQPRGVFLSDRIYQVLGPLLPGRAIRYGKLDITFYRDDFRKADTLHIPNQTRIDFSIEGQTVILIDDVLYTGRTIRSALDAMLDFGRPSRIKLLTLIDRRFSRELPIQPDYVGKSIDSIISQKVRVYWKERDGYDEVVLED